MRKINLSTCLPKLIFVPQHKKTSRRYVVCDIGCDDVADDHCRGVFFASEDDSIPEPKRTTDEIPNSCLWADFFLTANHFPAGHIPIVLFGGNYGGNR
jgi:hypothetical protein